jgi:hypothetical protein
MAYNIFWTQEDVRFEFVAEATDHPVLTVSIQTPVGDIALMAEPIARERTLVL